MTTGYDTFMSSPEPDWISGPAGSGSTRLFRTAVLLGTAAALVVAAAVVVLTRHPEWPTRCGVDGHQDGCARPLRAMTQPDVLAVARHHCPGIDSLEPQPLARADLAGGDTLARVTGTRRNGREDALLGAPATFAWVTRWVGGATDGRVEVRCAGASRRVASLRLDADQLASTIAAVDAEPSVDFSAVAESAARSVSVRGRPSLGFLDCDTGGVDLRRPNAGELFVCSLQVFSQQGQGGYRLTYRVTDDRPWFEPVPSA